jgi:predicted transcriptional regulator of viral defense system
MDYPSIRTVHMSSAGMKEGVEQLQIDGIQVPIFNAAKTVADCFKFRNKIGLDVALEALREGRRLRKFTNDDLWKYAVINRVSKVMLPFMEGVSA